MKRLISLFSLILISAFGAKSVASDIYGSIWFNIEHRGPELADSLFYYLNGPCSKRDANEKACEFTRLYPKYKEATKRIHSAFGNSWEAPEDWNVLVIRSGYWNPSPFLSVDEADEWTANIIEWLFLRKALAASLANVNPLLDDLSGNPATRGTKTIVPAIRAYLGGATPISRFFYALEQVGCLRKQTLCHSFVSSSRKKLRATLDRHATKASALRDAVANNESPLLSDLHVALARIVKLDQVFKEIDHTQKDSPQYSHYLNALKAETQIPKNLNRTARIKVWAQAIALNDLLEVHAKLQKSEPITSIPLEEKDLLKSISETLGVIEQFLIEQDLDSNSLLGPSKEMS